MWLVNALYPPSMFSKANAHAVIRNPIYFIFLILAGVGAYVTYTLNLWGPIIKMSNAAAQQALDIGKERLRDFLESNDAGRQALNMASAKDDSDNISMQSLDSRGRRKARMARGKGEDSEEERDL